MAIKGIHGLNMLDIQDEIVAGGKFVQFPWCISVVVFTFRFRSAPFFIRPNENAFIKSLPYTLLTFFFGWWGIHRGFVHTPACLYTNMCGGIDITADKMAVLHRHTNGHVFEFEKKNSLLSKN